ncbi:MAG: EAL domain-containing protein [Solirubrobacterales bacterium]|nr:EAL domain-containing protein [Solirubrobacterales bacterium]
MGSALAGGLYTVAEGIEREDQRRLLLELGCDLGQGYLMNPPLPAAASELIVGLL